MNVLETCVYARDIDAARRFYEEVMGLDCFVFKPPRQAFFDAGDGVFLVFNPDETKEDEQLPPHGADGSCHVCFRVDAEELDQWRNTFEDADLEVHEATWPNGDSLYVYDPAGNLVEVAPGEIWGKGQPNSG